MFNDDIRLTGHLKIELFRASGLIEVWEFDNLVVDNGKAWIAARMVGNTPVLMGWMAAGSGTTAPAVGDAGLQAELGRVGFDSVPGAVGPVVTYTATFGAGVATGPLTEAGIFNAASGGVMLSHVTYPVVNKGAADGMSIQWSITVT